MVFGWFRFSVSTRKERSSAAQLPTTCHSDSRAAHGGLLASALLSGCLHDGRCCGPFWDACCALGVHTSCCACCCKCRCERLAFFPPPSLLPFLLLRSPYTLHCAFPPTRRLYRFFTSPASALGLIFLLLLAETPPLRSTHTMFGHRRNHFRNMSKSKGSCQTWTKTINEPRCPSSLVVKHAPVLAEAPAANQPLPQASLVFDTYSVLAMYVQSIE